MSIFPSIGPPVGRADLPLWNSKRQLGRQQRSNNSMARISEVARLESTKPKIGDASLLDQDFQAAEAGVISAEVAVEVVELRLDRLVPRAAGAECGARREVFSSKSSFKH